MIFKVGDTVVYPHHGAALIEAIETRTIKGEQKEYLVLKVAQGDLTVRVPAENAEYVGVRDVVGQDLRRLRGHGVAAVAIHSALEPRERRLTLSRFAAGETRVLLGDDQNAVPSPARTLLVLGVDRLGLVAAEIAGYVMHRPAPPLGSRRSPRCR